jgi:hypothetical protein
MEVVGDDDRKCRSSRFPEAPHHLGVALRVTFDYHGSVILEQKPIELRSPLELFEYLGHQGVERLVGYRPLGSCACNDGGIEIESMAQRSFGVPSQHVVPLGEFFQGFFAGREADPPEFSEPGPGGIERV